MAEADRGLPERGDLVIGKAQGVAGDGAPREADQHHPLRVSGKAFADIANGGLGVRQGGLLVVERGRSPPTRDVVCALAAEVRQADHEGSIRAGQSLCQAGVFHTAGVGVTVLTRVGTIARQLDQDGVAAFGLPVGGQAQRVIAR